MRYGIGFYLLNEKDEIVSECVSIFRSKQQINIDIQTSSKERGKGFAKLLSQSLIKECVDKDLTPIWDCDNKNIASLKLAKK